MSRGEVLDLMDPLTPSQRVTCSTLLQRHPRKLHMTQDLQQGLLRAA